MSLPSKMKALVAHSAKNYALETIDVPVPGDGEMLLKVEACGICAGDVKATHGTARFWGGEGNPAFCKPPFVPGHEFVGRIAALGAHAPKGFQEGDRVVSEQIVPCGECYYCKRGKYWLCDPHDVYGFKSYLNGGMAEYVLLPQKSINYHVPESFSLEQSVLIEPLSCSLHGVRQSGATVDDTVVLAGAGPLGLGMVGALRMRNPKQLIVLDMIDKRLEKARALGADVTINPGTQNVAEEILKRTGGVGCDVYIEATGHPSSVQQGLDIIRKGGTFVEFSVMSGSSTIDFSIIGDTKEITMIGSQLSPYCYEDTIRAIAEGKLCTQGIVTHAFGLEDWQKAFAAAQTKDAIKVIICP